MKKVSLFASIFMLALASQMAFAQAVVIHDSDKTSGTSVVNSPCTEAVALQSTFHTMSNGVSTPSGGTNLVTRLQFKGQGVGMVSGDKYGVNQEFTQTISIPDGGLPFTFSSLTKVTINRQGGGGDYTAHGVFHITVDANGVLTSWIDNLEQDCK